MVALDTQDPVKERIIEHSRARFLTDGFARVSVDEITSELGMSKKTFYKYFGRKEDLVHLLVTRMIAEIDRRIDAVVTRDVPFPVKLDALVHLVGTVFKTISKNMIRDLQTHLPEAWTLIQNFRRDKIFSMWANMLEEGKRAGYVRPEISQRVFLLALTSTVEGIVNPKVLTNESFSADEALENIVTIFLKGILTPKAAGELHGFHHNS